MPLENSLEILYEWRVNSAVKSEKRSLALLSYLLLNLIMLIVLPFVLQERE